VPLHVIDGNHEDHGWLLKCRASGDVAAWSGANLIVHGRGTVDVIDGVPVGFIGGALPADRRQEWSGQWKPLADGSRPSGRRSVPKDPEWANWVTHGDVQRAITAFAATPPELVIAHSCPAGIGVGITGAQSLIEDADRFITRAGHHAGLYHDCGEGGLTTLSAITLVTSLATGSTCAVIMIQFDHAGVIRARSRSKTNQPCSSDAVHQESPGPGCDRS